MKIEQQYVSLVESLKLLASPFPQQVNALPEFVDVPFEVLDNFMNSFLLMPQLIENGFINNSATAAIIRCYNISFMTLLGNEEIMSLTALEKDDKWERARSLALIALKELKETPSEADLKHIRWSRS